MQTAGLNKYVRTVFNMLAAGVRYIRTSKLT